MKLLLPQREFWRELSAACVLAIVAAVPIMMSAVMERGFEIAKLAVVQPLAPLAAGAILIACGRSWLALRPPVVKVALAAIATLAVVAAIATVTAADPELALFGSYYRREGLFAWWSYCAFVLAVLAVSDRTDGVETIVDVMLIASVIPAAYAVQQRAGLDFFPLDTRDPSRSDGTLGSPVFMAAYAAMMIPVAVARAWEFRRATMRCLLWSSIALIGLAGLLSTQSRGPLLALAGGLLLFVLCTAARAGARRTLAAALVVFLSAASLSLAINASASAKRWAQTMPVLSRLVVELDLSAEGQSQRATRSALSRTVIWQGGLDTFVAAPSLRKLTGYGPDSAAEEFYLHVPAAIVRLLGYGEDYAFDRTHADMFDYLLMFGIVGWAAYLLFFLAVMYAAAKVWWQPANSPRVAIYALVTLVPGVLAAAVVHVAGYAAACVPAFGLGCGAGVFIFISAGSLRALAQAANHPPEPGATEPMMLAGLTAALWIFWMDAQINVPVPTTRLIAFALAALILVCAQRRDRAPAAGQRAAIDMRPRIFGFTCVMIATVGSCIPNVLYVVPDDLHWGLRMVPIAVALVTAVAAARTLAETREGKWRAWLMSAGAVVGVYVLLHVALMVHPDAQIKAGTDLSIALASAAMALFVAGSAIAFAWSQCRSGSAQSVSRLSGYEWIAAGGVVIYVLGVAVCDWQQRRGEIAYTLATRLTQSQPELSERLLEEAIAQRPPERYYRRQLALLRLSYALGGLEIIGQTPPGAPEVPLQFEYVIKKLAQAESTARAAVAIFPRDPWAIATLANVLQIEALGVLRPLNPGGSAARAKEADELFARAHRIFPTEPLILRNWAQFLADQGELERAYRVFDRMEALTPADPLPYVARIAAAVAAADHATTASTLARARQNLQSDRLKEVLDVAEAQHRR